MIIAVDFDGTLMVDRQPNTALIMKLKREQSMGNTVILWSCREGKRLKDAVIFLRQHGFVPNFVNCNSPLGIKKMGHDSRKVYADLYIDDKNINVNL